MNKKFVITRLFATPRDLMWKAWTEPKLFSEWFGPKGCRSQVKTCDVKVGGSLHSSLTTPDGNVMWAKFVYREVIPQKRLVWEHSFSDESGNIARHFSHPVWPLKLLTTVVFEDVGGKTKVSLAWEPLEATDAECKGFEDAMPSMEMGWGGTFEQLEAFLGKKAA